MCTKACCVTCVVVVADMGSTHAYNALIVSMSIYIINPLLAHLQTSEGLQ